MKLKGTNPFREPTPEQRQEMWAYFQELRLGDEEAFNIRLQKDADAFDHITSLSPAKEAIIEVCAEEFLANVLEAEEASDETPA